MADIPDPALAAGAEAVNEVYAKRGWNKPAPWWVKEVSAAVLEAAAPLLAEAWGVKPDDELRAQFAELKAKWLDATMIESSAQRIAFDMSCQRIIGLGPRAVPLILEDLAAEHNHWFWALTVLAGEDKAAGEVTVPGAVQKWLEWGRGRGLIPEVPREAEDPENVSPQTAATGEDGQP